MFRNAIGMGPHLPHYAADESIPGLGVGKPQYRTPFIGERAARPPFFQIERRVNRALGADLRRGCGARGIVLRDSPTVLYQ